MAKAAKAVIGHNDTEASEKDKRAARRKLIVEQLLAVAAKIEPLLAERKAIRAAAKADFKLSEIDAAMRLATMEDQSIFVEEIKELIAIAQAFNALPPGEQGDLFPDRRDGAEKSFDAGKFAGIDGKNPEPPSGFDAPKWMEGWHAGQAIRRDEMQRDMERRNAANAELIKGGDDDPFADGGRETLEAAE